MNKAKPHAFQFASPKYWPTWFGIALLHFSAILPYSLQMKLGRLLGALSYLLMRRRRHIVETNIKLCFPELSQPKQQQLVKHVFDSTGMTIFEVAISWWASDRKLNNLHHIEGIEHLHNALNNNKGVILLVSHFSTMEIAGTFLGKHINNLAVVYKRAHNPLFEWYIQKKRKNNCAHLVKHTNLREIIRKIKHGDVVWYSPDQDFGEKDSIFAPFMGVETCTLLSTQKLAKITGAAVVPFFAERLNNDKGYTLHFSPTLENFPTGEERADATAINNAIEQQIRQAPEQYLWIHRRFKSRPKGTPNVYK